MGRAETYPVKIVNWGFWNRRGEKPLPGMANLLEESAVPLIQPGEGIEAIQRILFHAAPQVSFFNARDYAKKLLHVDTERQVEYCVKISQSVPAAAEDLAAVPRLGAEQAKSARAVKELCSYALLKMYQQQGVFAGGGELCEKEYPKNRFALLPGYARLYEALLGILEDAGFIRVDGEEIVTTGELDREDIRDGVRTLAEKKDALLAAFPDQAPAVRLLWTCLEKYPAILRGETTAVDVLFPTSSMELVRGIYQGNAVADYFNGLVAQAVRSSLQARKPSLGAGETFRIMEIGAGTGGTSAFVLDAVRQFGDIVRYVYTDVSKAFTQHGEGAYADRHPFAEFKVFDVEKDIEGQGFEPGSFDLVIAANVLHATKNIRDTLRNTKRLLKAKGALILYEGTQVQDILTLTFGLLDGWWRYEDDGMRLRSSPLLAASTWNVLLREEGFQQVRMYGSSEEAGEDPGCRVIVSNSDGVVIMRRGAEGRRGKRALADYDNLIKRVDREKAVLEEKIIINSTQIIFAFIDR